MVDVTHDGDDRGTDLEILLLTLMLAELEIEGLQQLAVLILGRDDLDVVVQLAAQQPQRVVVDRLRGRDHLAEADQHLHEIRRKSIDALSEVGEAGATRQTHGLAAAPLDPDTVHDRRLHVVELLALRPLRLPPTRRPSTGLAEGARRRSATARATGTTTRATGTTAGTAGTTGTPRATGTTSIAAGTTRATRTRTGTSGTTPVSAGTTRAGTRATRTCTRATGPTRAGRTGRHHAGVGTRGTRDRRSRAAHAGARTAAEGVVARTGSGRAAHPGAGAERVVARTGSGWAGCRPRASRLGSGRRGRGRGGLRRGSLAHGRHWCRGRRRHGGWGRGRYGPGLDRRLDGRLLRCGRRSRGLLRRGGLLGRRLLRSRLGLCGGHRLAQSPGDRRLDRGRCRLHELAHVLQLGEDILAGYPELLGELMDPNLRHDSPVLVRAGCSGPSVHATHVHRRALMGCSSSNSRSVRPATIAGDVRPGRVPEPIVPGAVLLLDRRAEEAEIQRTLHPQRPAQGPGTFRSIEALLGGVQMSTATRQPSGEVRDDPARLCHDPDERRRIVPDPTSHAHAEEPERGDRCRVYPSGHLAQSTDGAGGTSEPLAAGSAAAVSGRISIRQPVRRAASRAFCPSRPMARESW